MKLHAVLPHATNKIWVRDTSCFGDCCFMGSFQQDTSCEGWRLVNLKVTSVVLAVHEFMSQPYMTEKFTLVRS